MHFTILWIYFSGVCLKCYSCSPSKAIIEGKSFTPQQCEQNQTELTCQAPYDRCIKAHEKKKNQDGIVIEYEFRSCANKLTCDQFQRALEQAQLNGWDASIACCLTELCNSAFQQNMWKTWWMVSLSLWWTLMKI